MEKPLVSVIIPCYNQYNYLQESIDSVLASTYENIEIIVVNDGSDEFSDELKKFTAPKTIIINQNNQGLSSARNSGIKIAKGKYILPLDADDKIHPNYIEKAVNILEKQPQIGIVYCKAEFFGEKRGEWKIDEYKFPDILWTNSIFCSALYKKADWEKVGGYKKEMNKGFEDWEFWISLIENGAEVFRIPEILFYYRQNSNNMSSSMSVNGYRKEMIKLIINFHSTLYCNNVEKILYPLIEVFESYIKKTSILCKLKYKLNKILVNLSKKISIIK